jgi:hypothetical protein
MAWRLGLLVLQAVAIVVIGWVLVVFYIVTFQPEVKAAEWTCLAEGWSAGDVWGPGPDDVVPSAPPCPVETYDPRPSAEPIEVLSIDTTETSGDSANGSADSASGAAPAPSIPGMTLPPTDTK